MVEAWRIIRRQHVENAFDGEGARRAGGRWNSKGTAIVYTADSLPLALLEVMVHVPSYAQLQDRLAIPIQLAKQQVETLPEERLPPDWRATPPLPETQRIGDTWAQEERSLALKLPSVVVPRAFNYVINPRHPAFSDARIGAPEELRIDPRLVK